MRLIQDLVIWTLMFALLIVSLIGIGAAVAVANIGYVMVMGLL